MKIKAIKCLNCCDTVYSRTVHDFRECSCQQVFVSGGFSYFKYGAIPGAEYETMVVDVDISLEILHDDWNAMRDEYGIIKELDGNEEGMIYKV